MEGTRLQMQSNVDKTGAVIVSTVMEAWEVVEAGLFADGTVNDVSPSDSTLNLPTRLNY